MFQSVFHRYLPSAWCDLLWLETPLPLMELSISPSHCPWSPFSYVGWNCVQHKNNIPLFMFLIQQNRNIHKLLKLLRSSHGWMKKSSVQPLCKWLQLWLLPITGFELKHRFKKKIYICILRFAVC